VVNAGSDELSLFAVQPDGLRLADRAGSGGSKPTSVAVSGTLVYVLNNGTPSISGFRLADGKLTAIPESARKLSSADADPAQVSFTTDGRVLIVTERGTDTISSYLIDESGYAQGPATITSSGQTPYGFGLTADGSLIVSEAFGGTTGAAAASSYAVSGAGELTMVSGSVSDTRSEVCWVALSKDDRFAYVTNFGDGTVSSPGCRRPRSGTGCGAGAFPRTSARSWPSCGRCCRRPAAGASTPRAAGRRGCWMRTGGGRRTSRRRSGALVSSPVG